ncbi:MAG: hypothetical protein ACEQSX_13430, partial [Baekduiaceae bacterium]
MPRRLLLTLLAVALPCAPAAAQDPAPYTSVTQIGDRANGTLRFPQSIAIGADGNVYVGDQGTHVIQVFRPDGSFLRTVGEPGPRP